LYRATEALRSGLPTVRFSPSRKVNRRRLGPQVRLPPLFTMTGKTVGSVGAVVQPSWFSGGAGAGTQSPGAGDPPDGTPGDAVGGAPAVPAHAATARAAVRRLAAQRAVAGSRGSFVGIAGERSRGAASAPPAGRRPIPDRRCREGGLE
jgi:hypothetical protein